MHHRSTVAWPRREARIAGFLYLLVIILGGFAEIGVAALRGVSSLLADTPTARLAGG